MLMARAWQPRGGRTKQNAASRIRVPVVHLLRIVFGPMPWTFHSCFGRLGVDEGGGEASDSVVGALLLLLNFWHVCPISEALARVKDGARWEGRMGRPKGW